MIGDIVKKIRHEKGLTQKQLAENIGISESTIKMIETNKSNPSVELLSKLADALGVEPGVLISNKEREEKVNSFTMKLLEKLVREGMIENPNDIKEEEINLILAAIKMDIRRMKKDF